MIIHKSTQKVAHVANEQHVKEGSLNLNFSNQCRASSNRDCFYKYFFRDLMINRDRSKNRDRENKKKPNRNQEIKATIRITQKIQLDISLRIFLRVCFLFLVILKRYIFFVIFSRNFIRNRFTIPKDFIKYTLRVDQEILL